MILNNNQFSILFSMQIFKLKLLNKNLLIFIFLFMTLIQTHGNTIDLTTSSPHLNDKSRYWTMNKISPLTIEIAINNFFLKEKLHPLEGIWIQDNEVVIAIVRESEFLYRKYIIENKKNKKLNGITEGTYHRSKQMDKFAIFERFGGEEFDNNFFTAMGKLTLIYNHDHAPKINKPDDYRKLFEFLKNVDRAEGSIKSYKKFKNLKKNYQLKRIYPLKK